MFSLSCLPPRVIGQVPPRGRLFSTARTLRGGSFFDLARLGASREAQYLSKQHGIPRTEFSANTHLIRSGEVDPSAPAPGASPRVVAARAGQAAAEASIQDAELSRTTAARNSLVVQLRLAREELAQTKSAYGRLQVRAKGLETALMLVPALVSMIAFIGYQVYRERTEQPAGPWQSLLISFGARAQRPGSEDYGSSQAYRDATVEEHNLAESGLTSFETQPMASTSTGRSVFSGLFWARN